MFVYIFRLVEEVKEKCGAALTNEDVYMSTTYKDFLTITVLRSRGVSLKKPFTYDAVNSRYSIRISSCSTMTISASFR